MNIHYYNKAVEQLRTKAIDSSFPFKNRKTAAMEYILECNPPNQDGLWLEFGVFQGSSINLIANHTNHIFGFDSFSGFPEDGRNDWQEDRFNINGKLPTTQENVTLISGFFSETLPQFLLEHPDKKVSFLHIDCDIYSSTKFVLNELSHRFHSGTIIVFDELIHYSGFEDNEWKAFIEFTHQTGTNFEWLAIKDKVLSYEQHIEFCKKHSQGSTPPDFKTFRNHGYEQEVVVRIC